VPCCRRMSQEIDGMERPIAFASRLLADCETRYASTKSELLGLVWAVRYFRCYLLGKPFIVRTDHRSLEHLSKFKEPSAIIARWLEFLSQFEFVVKYRRGRAHANADAMSRHPTHQLDRIVGLVEEEDVLPTPLVRRFNWTWSQWEEEQKADSDVSQLHAWLVSGFPPDFETVPGASPALHYFWKGRAQFVLHEGVVCREWQDPCPSKPSIKQVVIPRHLVSRVLNEYHDFGGHTGGTRLYKRLQTRFYWVGMKRDVEDWVATCSSCNQLKKPVGRGAGAPLKVSWTGYPFERIAMDLIPNLPETYKGNRHILVIVDYFTKWVEAYPLPKMDALTIAVVFMNEFVTRFGAPDKLHTDQGKNFDSVLFKGVCSLLGIDKTRTTAYHPASDGLVERFNQTLERGLAHYVAGNHRDWDTQLPAMLMAYRSTPQVSTGYTPAYLLFGRELCLPQDLAFGLPPGDGPDPITAPDFVVELRRRLTNVHELVRDRLGDVHRYQAHVHDSRAVAVTFKAGDLVWLLVPAIPVGTSAKFSKLWHGPYEVIDRISDVVYRIQTSTSPNKCQIVHVNRLKACKLRPTRLSMVPETTKMDVPARDGANDRSPSTPDATLVYDADDDNAEVFGQPLVAPMVGGRFPRSRRRPNYYGGPIPYD